MKRHAQGSGGGDGLRGAAVEDDEGGDRGKTAPILLRLARSLSPQASLAAAFALALVALGLLVLVWPAEPEPVAVRRESAFEFSNPPDSARSARVRVPTSPESPVVTVITAVDQFTPISPLREAGASLRRQTLARFEWLVVEDGSLAPPAAAALHAGVCRTDSRIQCLRADVTRGASTEKGASGVGLAAARNLGLDRAVGQFVAYVDADDLLEATALEQMVWFLLTHPSACMVTGWVVEFGAANASHTQGFELGNRILEENTLADSVLLLRASEARAPHGRWDPALRDGEEEWDLLLHLASHGCWGYTVPELLSWHRARPQSLSTAPSSSSSSTAVTAATAAMDATAVRKPRSGLRGTRVRLHDKYPDLFFTGVPTVPIEGTRPADPFSFDVPFANGVEEADPMAVATDSAARVPAGHALVFVPELGAGDADTALLALLTELAGPTHRWTITLVTTTLSEQPGYARFAAVTDDILGVPNFLRLHDAPRFLQYLAQSRHADVVLVCNSNLGAALVPFLRAATPTVGLLELVLDDGVHARAHPGVARPPDSVLRAAIDRTLYASAFLAAARGHALDARAVVTPIGVPDAILQHSDAERNRARRQYGPASRSPLVFLFHTELDALDRPLVVVETVAHIVGRVTTNTEPAFVVYVLGNGPRRSAMEERVRERRLAPWFRFVGALRAREHLVDYYLAADVFFLPSAHDATPYSVVHAMAYGLAVVAAASPGRAELLDDDTGLLVPITQDDALDAVAFADALRGPIQNHVALLILGENAKKKVQARRWTESRFAADVAEQLADVRKVAQGRWAQGTLPDALDVFRTAEKQSPDRLFPEPQPHSRYK